MPRRILETREIESHEVKEFQEADWEILSVAPGTRKDGTAYFLYSMARFSEFGMFEEG
ncbi:hypothetical protein IMF22_15700 [Pseudomonas poae]|uniref:Uncharacterized protein n=1 Tax=Pseudomonas poae TaxID=200451 RepID=A0A7M1K9N0_9PSED|nr:hypothetical protein [Pseudomonas poae]QOQ72965.1 hypothetical protein IMF22_15700 [Pseudomonas poae]